MKNDHRLDQFAPLLVRNADDGGAFDRRVLVKDVLDLPGEDVEAAADNHVLGAVHNVEVSLLVELAHVSGPQPAVPERLRRLFGLLEIARHHVDRPADDVARFPPGHLPAVLPDDPHIRRHHRPAAGLVDPHALLRIGDDVLLPGQAADHHGCLRLAEELGEDRPQGVHRLGKARRGDGRCAVDDVAQAAEIVLLQVRRIEEDVDHRGNDEGRCDLHLFHPLQEQLRVEMVLDLAGPPLQQDRQDQAASRVGERRRKGEHLVPVQSEVQHLADEGPHPGVLVQHHPLGEARRSAGVEDPHQVLAVQVDLRHLRRAVVDEPLQVLVARSHRSPVPGHADVVPDRLQGGDHLLHATGHLLMVDDRFALGLVHHVDVIPGIQKHRQGNADQAELSQGVFAKDVFGAVRHEKRHPVALLQPQVVQGVGQRIGLLLHLVVGVRFIVVENSGVLPKGRDRPVVQIRTRNAVKHRRHSCPPCLQINSCCFLQDPPLPIATVGLPAARERSALTGLSSR